jgi:uncharacterized protein
MVDGVTGFDWDAGNLAKCQKHGVSIEEIEAVFGPDVIISPDLRHSALEQRLIAVNRNADRRPIFVAFTLREVGEETLIRPVTARYMHLEEVARYEKSTRTEN